MLQFVREWKMEFLLRCLHEAQDPTLYQFVADQLEEHELCFRQTLSPVAYHSLGYLLPLVYSRDDQRTMMLSKGLQKGWDDCQKPKGGLAINLHHSFALHTQNSVV